MPEGRAACIHDLDLRLLENPSPASMLAGDVVFRRSEWPVQGRCESLSVVGPDGKFIDIDRWRMRRDGWVDSGTDDKVVDACRVLLALGPLERVRAAVCFWFGGQSDAEPERRDGLQRWMAGGHDLGLPAPPELMA